MLNLSKIEAGELDLKYKEFDISNLLLNCMLTFEQEIEKKEINISGFENIKNQLATFGVPITINYVSNENFSNVLNNKSYDMILTGIRCAYSPSLETFFGGGNIAIGVIVLITGIVSGIMMIVNGGRILKAKRDMMF